MGLKIEWCVYLCLIVIPLVYGATNKTVPTQEKQVNNDTQPIKSSIEHFTTNITLPSEGGTLITSVPDVILPKNKQLATLLALDGELDKPKETSVHPRKGVGNYTEDVSKNNATNLKEILLPLASQANNTKQAVTIEVNKNKTLSDSKSSNTTEKPKKPLILSYEALNNADKLIKNETRLPIINPSSNSITNLAKSQIPSPNEGDIVKVYPTKANSHPGMIMPIVITILVVPMFAIFGYMALKRGREAWKNRHYKRMDFLLDGMYND